ncbi:Hint domain-containing protein [Rhodoblastus acidophilus]|uniref:Hint domain-containing protein n=1 Tax=Candidatus Rhodoblastus alkanivorans TaxID=2954117 RepID=A0ABS9Z891_9HYPH|nr:Hint domain-containing protein [Candidatus Rhodoblastus alkanivorans]MCI4678010.1 Hint domain-containing protein [Candidatus Rhodoblastus alkanivorans]MCI4683905.1 Hint domain-containing protein [Candidatus Rhodoblastus alkanivorans]MDI4641222.1 Hint domain-containing protein [Rhodoblastus acidophilus]
MANNKVTSGTISSVAVNPTNTVISGTYTASNANPANAVYAWAVASDGTGYFLGSATGLGAGGSYTITSTTSIPSGTYTVELFNVNSTTLPTGSPLASDPSQNLCFLAGTMIRTPDGEAAIETLKRGDLVLTSEVVAKPVNWLGKQTVSRLFADPVRSLPIRVRAGALAQNVPVRDLLVSPDHALLVDGVLIHAGALVNGTSIVRETDMPQVFVYYHVELDDHSLILAENTPAETFVDNVDRMNFDNWAEFEALYPEGKAVEELPYPRAKAHRQVPVYIRVALADRAHAIGAAPSAVA